MRTLPRQNPKFQSSKQEVPNATDSDRGLEKKAKQCISIHLSSPLIERATDRDSEQT